MVHPVNFYPFQYLIIKTGDHNLFPSSLLYYIPKLDRSVEPFFKQITYHSDYQFFNLGIKKTSDEMLMLATSNNKDITSNRIYKLICSNRNVNKLFYILNKDKFDFNNEVIYKTMNSLHLAARLNNFEVVHFLLNIAKVDINKQDSNGNSALHYAVENGNDLMVKYLLKYNASLDLLDNYGFDVNDKRSYRGLNKIDYTSYKDANTNKDSISKKLYLYIEPPDYEKLSGDRTNKLYPSKLLGTCEYELSETGKSFDNYVDRSYYIYFTKSPSEFKL